MERGATRVLNSMPLPKQRKCTLNIQHGSMVFLHLDQISRFLSCSATGSRQLVHVSSAAPATFLGWGSSVTLPSVRPSDLSSLDSVITVAVGHTTILAGSMTGWNVSILWMLRVPIMCPISGEKKNADKIQLDVQYYKNLNPQAGWLFQL